MKSSLLHKTRYSRHTFYIPGFWNGNCEPEVGLSWHRGHRAEGNLSPGRLRSLLKTWWIGSWIFTWRKIMKIELVFTSWCLYGVGAIPRVSMRSFIPRVDSAVTYVFPQEVGLLWSYSLCLGFSSSVTDLQRSVIQGFVLGLMNSGFFCPGNWLQNLLNKALVWWASPGCGAEGAFTRYGLPSSRAGWWIWPALHTMWFFYPQF